MTTSSVSPPRVTRRPARTRRPAERVLRFVPRLFGHGLLIFWTVLTLIPFVLIALFSFRDNQDIYAHPLGIGGAYHLSNYAIAWDGPSSGTAGMATYFKNTVIAAVVALLVNLICGSLGAYFVTRLPVRRRNWYVRLFVIATVVPFVLLIVPYFRLYNALGLLESPAAIGVAYAGLALPTTVLVLYAHFTDFPKSLIEAAKVDGLGEFDIFLRIVAPLSRGALVTVSTLLIVFVWNEAQLGIVLLQDSYRQTIPVGLLAFQGEFVTELGPIFAGLTLASVPVIVLYFGFGKYITRGIALGGFFR
jgi:raffinose/stachyose/melibiose transport system permease protein